MNADLKEKGEKINRTKLFLWEPKGRGLSPRSHLRLSAFICGSN
jgi:hypothetical protein